MELQRYRYAQRHSSTVVDVTKLTPQARKRRGPFVCIGCGGEMIARLGSIRAKHFAHKAALQCSRETYLHRLAKAVFVERFKAAKRTGRPIRLIYTAEQTCSHYENAIGRRCKRRVSRSIDLASVYDEATVEGVHGGFRADVLLTSSGPPRKPMFIEFAVTHECDTGKTDSGNRIIEFAVRDESDVARLRRGYIRAERDTVRFHNFKIRRHVEDCEGHCSVKRLGFFVFSRGTALLSEAESPAYLAAQLARPDLKYSRVLPASLNFDRSTTFVNELRIAHFRQQNVRNCFLCRYHGLGLDKSVFCKILRLEFASNQAAQCRYYKSFQSRAEADAADASNRQYLQRTWDRRFWST